MSIIKDEEIVISAFQLYKENIPYGDMSVALAKVCKALQISQDEIIEGHGNFLNDVLSIMDEYGIFYYVLEKKLMDISINSL